MLGILRQKLSLYRIVCKQDAFKFPKNGSHEICAMKCLCTLFLFWWRVCVHYIYCCFVSEFIYLWDSSLISNDGTYEICLYECDIGKISCSSECCSLILWGCGNCFGTFWNPPCRHVFLINFLLLMKFVENSVCSLIEETSLRKIFIDIELS